MLDQVRLADIDSFYTPSPLGPRSKAKMLDRLRSFFRFAVHREWIAKSPVSPDLKPPAGAASAVNKMPFTDEQLADIIKACDHLEDRRWGNRHGAGLWTGEDLKDFMLSSGDVTGAIAIAVAAVGRGRPGPRFLITDAEEYGVRHRLSGALPLVNGERYCTDVRKAR